MPKIGQFLIDLSEHPERLVAYHENPRAVLAESELTEEEQEIILSDEPAELLKALQSEYPDAEFVAEAWKPIRFPLPIPRPRPIRRVGT